ncbi:uncharacterized protein METZ01_LOCUS36475 [marine metagenome]|uniref:Uncharacterized protein n=1 Tax=marine metagenome TaxID=408172 RepID=A0A381QW29_9ZZZZ
METFPEKFISPSSLIEYGEPVFV